MCPSRGHSYRCFRMEPFRGAREPEHRTWSSESSHTHVCWGKDTKTMTKRGEPGHAASSQRRRVSRGAKHVQSSVTPGGCVRLGSRASGAGERGAQRGSTTSALRALVPLLVQNRAAAAPVRGVCAPPQTQNQLLGGTVPAEQLGNSTTTRQLLPSPLAGRSCRRPGTDHLSDLARAQATTAPPRFSRPSLVPSGTQACCAVTH